MMLTSPRLLPKPRAICCPEAASPSRTSQPIIIGSADSSMPNAPMCPHTTGVQGKGWGGMAKDPIGAELLTPEKLVNAFSGMEYGPGTSCATDTGTQIG